MKVYCFTEICENDVSQPRLFHTKGAMFDAINEQASYNDDTVKDRWFFTVAGKEFDLEQWDGNFEEIMCEEFETMSWQIACVSIES